MSKRKTDEQRAREYAKSEGMSPHLIRGFIAGLRSERRAIKREQQRIVDEVLSGPEPTAAYTYQRGYFQGGRELAKALGLKVKP